MEICLPLTLTVSDGWTFVPGSVTGWPLTVTLPCLMSSAASRREQTPEWAMYLFSGSWSPEALGEPGLPGAGFEAPGAGLVGAALGEGLAAAPGAGLPGAALDAPLAGLPGLRPGAYLPGLRPGAGLPGAPVCACCLRETGPWVCCPCWARAFRFSSKCRSMASLRSRLAAFFSWRKASLMAALFFLL